jgi:tRNA(Arg) A34 adenosine deaminase TadA
MVLTQLQLALPDWAGEAVARSTRCVTDDARIALAIDLSRRNVEARTGGPFGAVVFGPGNEVVAAGVNCVLPQSCSVAHAEIMAIMLAQRSLGRARLNRDDEGQPIGLYTLAASSQPCCQCYGALVWAGIDRLIIGARAEDVMTESAFDEGPLPANWVGELERRGIEVIRDVRRDEARQVLRAYSTNGGVRY